MRKFKKLTRFAPLASIVRILNPRARALRQLRSEAKYAKRIRSENGAAGCLWGEQSEVHFTFSFMRETFVKNLVSQAHVRAGRSSASQSKNRK